MDTQDLWKYFVDTSYETGKITDEEGNQKQAAYSLYRAFYGEHKDYPRVENDLLRGYFGEKKLRFTSTEKGALEREISARFGDRANAYIESRPLINDAQQKAIKNGLVQPLALVQGPPGTGKTEMILNFLAVITRLSPDSTAAVVSCNSEALSNITDALAAMKEQAIKNNAPDDIMVQVCDRCAILGNQEKRKEWSDRVDRKFLANMDKYIFKRELLETYPIFTSTIHSLPNLFSKEARFDYVIIDECSQVSVSLGLVAMAYAKHLMLVGDNLQLQAIIPDKALKKTAALPEDKRIYLEEDGKSFLKACETLFPDAPGVLLNEHYRCHQSIANFCNEYVYVPENSRLSVKTYTPQDEADDCRIDITWYDGAYMEQPDLFLTKEKKKAYAEEGPLDKEKEEEKEPDKKIPSQKNNFRQIDIFIEEMLPELKKRLDGPNPPTVCVLAPFRLQLQLLQERLETELSGELELNEGLDLDNERQNAGSSQNRDFGGLPSLSIHKAQGKGYDIVYVMTVEDLYESSRTRWGAYRTLQRTCSAPWGQNRRIINVAVSRAKKELHIITSRIWIPQYIQKRLPGFEKAAPLPDCIRALLGEEPDEETEKAFYNNWRWERGEKQYEPKENLYIGRLCQWVYDNWGAEEQRNKFGGFGFRRAKTSSRLDGFAGDAHEKIKNALMDARLGLGRDGIETHVSLDNAPQLAEALKYKKQSRTQADGQTPLETDDFTEKDFIFVCRDNWIRAIIHVLGPDYRNACLEKYGFFKRLDCRIKKTCGEDKYIAVPTNRELGGKVHEILEKYDASSDDLVFKENPAIQLLKNRTGECLDALLEALGKCRSADTALEEKEEIFNALKLNYGRATDVSYKPSVRQQPLTQQYYLCRYGTAYAFEYALMYDIVFHSAETKEFHILSLGCGSCIDALAAGYSRDRCKKEISLTYKGIDRVKWDVNFLDADNGTDDVKKHFDAAEFVREDIVGYFEKPGNEKLDSNVIFFPKILNELDRETRQKLLAAAANCRLDTDVDEYYFCVSHSQSAAAEDGRVMEQFINALGNHERYSYSSSVSSFFDLEKNEAFRSRWGLKKEKMLADHDGIYEFPRGREFRHDERKIKNLNADFSDARTDEEMRKAIKSLKQMDDGGEYTFRHRIRKVDEVAFQIIRLKKSN